MQCVLVGNYGVGNIGDEALREYFVETFSEVEWIVVSGKRSGKWTHLRQGFGGQEVKSEKYEEVSRLPFGIRSFFAPWLAGRSSAKRSEGWWKTVSAIRHADAVVFGGGSLFTDVESVRACLMWWTYAATARFFWCPYHLAFQGVGPFRTFFGWWIAKKVFQGAASVSVRDEQSLERVLQWKLRYPPVLSFDPAFALFAKRGVKKQGTNALVLIPRANSKAAFLEAVKKALPAGIVRILLLEPARESAIASTLLSLAPEASVVEIRSVQQLLDEVGGASHVVSQRFHGALAAVALGIPVTIVPQAEGDKLDGLRKAIPSQEQSSRSGLVTAGRTALRSSLQSEAFL